MSTASTVCFGRSSQGLFDPDEVRELMDVEFERALRYDYPITCLLMQVDRLDELETTYGYEIRTEILQALTRLLQQETRAGDFLGTLIDDRLLVLLPHTSGEVGMMLARRFLESARKLEFDIGGRTMRITLSIGLSHNRHRDARSFGTLVSVAEEGASVADSAGGNRCVETELYTLFERNAMIASAQRASGRLEELAPSEPRAAVPAAHERRRPPPERTTLRPQAAPPPAAAPAPAPPRSELASWIRGPKDDELRRRLEALIESEGSLEAAVARMSAELLASARAAKGADSLSTDKESEYQREIDILRRRVGKLTHSLGLTEEALRRIQEGKALDGGLASIYREVQGLDAGDPRSDLKRELMASIFAANLDLQKKASP